MEQPPSSRCLNTKSTGVLGAHARGGSGPKGAPTLHGVSKHQSNQFTTDRPYYLRLMPTPEDRCAKGSAARLQCV